ncbi:MAG TPA: potassium/proton antiporter [Bacteroidales bacterium]|nr:potassium/proton antiporter [Bacteroidales bacterium]
MSINFQNILLVGSILLMISILAGKTSFRFGVPVILLFVIVGILAGSEGIGGINFSDPEIARMIGTVALNFILFSGGLETRKEVIRPVLWHGLTLSTIGVFITALSLGFFVSAVTDLTVFEGLLLGSIVSSTDAAAVFSILRSKNLSLKKNLRATLELESGSNDPMAYFLTIAFTGLIVGEYKSWVEIIPFFVQQMLVGAAAGLLMGKLGKELINRIKLDFEGLYPVLVIALMFFTFSVTDFLGGNGFLAIYLNAVYIGNQHIIHKRTIMQVFDGIAWLMQIILFLALGLLVFPSHIVPVIGTGLIISAFLMLVARPIGTFISLLPFRLKPKNITFISWVGLRGAVPIVFATYPLLAGIESAGMIFNIVFFVSLTSVIIQGTTLPKVAKWLHVAVPEKVRSKSPADVELGDGLKSEMLEIELSPDCPAMGKKIVDIDFPPSATIAVIRREGKYLVPNGLTVIQPGDILLVLAESKASLELVRNCILSESAPRKSNLPNV